MASPTREIKFSLNGRSVSATVRVHVNALTMLRDQFELTGAKIACGEGQCAACTILVDGDSVNGCLMLAVNCDGREVTTIEGLDSVDGWTLSSNPLSTTGRCSAASVRLA